MRAPLAILVVVSSLLESAAAAPSELQTCAADRARVLPVGGVSELSAALSRVDLVAAMKDLARRRFQLPDRAGDHALGDLLLALEKDPRAALDAATARAIVERHPDLVELLDDSALRQPGWTPDEAHDSDGFLHGPTLDREQLGIAPWTELRGSTSLLQAAVLARADVATLKEAEVDYPSYLERPGNSYLEIHPVAGSLQRGRDTHLGEFVAMQIRFRSELPFPFGTYECRIQQLDRLDKDGMLISDVYSTSPDFHWLAGRDVYIPVLTSAGEPVATLVVRQFGFDLRGVPEGDSQRRAGLRSGLGCLKRHAEQRFAAKGGRHRQLDGLPEYPVKGWR